MLREGGGVRRQRCQHQCDAVDQGHEQEWMQLAVSQHATLRKMVAEDVHRLEEGQLEAYQMLEAVKAVAEGRILAQLQRAEKTRVKELTP